MEDETEGPKLREEDNPNRVHGRLRRGGRVESGVIEVERWLNEREPSRASSHRRDHYEGREYDEEEEFGNEEEHHRQHRRPHGQVPHYERRRELEE